MNKKTFGAGMIALVQALNGCGTTINTRHTREAHQVGVETGQAISGMERIFQNCQQTKQEIEKCVMSSEESRLDFALSFVEKFQKNLNPLPPEFTKESIISELNNLEKAGYKFEYDGKKKTIIRISLKGMDIAVLKAIPIEFAPSFLRPLKDLLQWTYPNDKAPGSEMVPGSAVFLNPALIKASFRNGTNTSYTRFFVEHLNLINGSGLGDIDQPDQQTVISTFKETQKGTTIIHTNKTTISDTEIVTLGAGGPDEATTISKIIIKPYQLPSYHRTVKIDSKREITQHFYRYGNLQIEVDSEKGPLKLTKLDQLTAKDNYETEERIVQLDIKNDKESGFYFLYLDKQGKKVVKTLASTNEDGIMGVDSSQYTYFSPTNNSPFFVKTIERYFTEEEKKTYKKKLDGMSDFNEIMSFSSVLHQLRNKRVKWTLNGTKGVVNDYLAEKTRNPGLSIDAWLKDLADQLDSAWHWTIFYQLFFNESGIEGLEGIPKPKNNTIRTTAEIFEKNAMPNSREMAFIVKDLLALQGVKSEIIHVPKHDFTVFWLINNSDGSFDVNYFNPILGYGKNGTFARLEESQPFLTAKPYNSHLEALKDGFRVVYPEKDPAERDQDAATKFFLWKSLSGSIPIITLNEAREPIGKMQNVNSMIN